MSAAAVRTHSLSRQLIGGVSAGGAAVRRAVFGGCHRPRDARPPARVRRDAARPRGLADGSGAGRRRPRGQCHGRPHGAGRARAGCLRGAESNGPRAGPFVRPVRRTACCAECIARSTAASTSGLDESATARCASRACASSTAKRTVDMRRPVTVLYASPTRDLWHGAVEAVWFYIAASALLLAATGIALVWFLRRRLSPLQELAAIAGRVSTRSWEFVPPAAVLRTTELAPIALSMEELLKGLQLAFERQRRLTGDAAHELKTSIAVLKSSLQLLSMAPRTAEQYEAGLEGLLLDSERMEELVSRMLTLARLEEAAVEARASCDLQSVVRDGCGTAAAAGRAETCRVGSQRGRGARRRHAHRRRGAALLEPDRERLAAQRGERARLRCCAGVRRNQGVSNCASPTGAMASPHPRCRMSSSASSAPTARAAGPAAEQGLASPSARPSSNGPAEPSTSRAR